MKYYSYELMNKFVGLV